MPEAFKTFKEWWDKTNAHNIEQDGRYGYNYKQLLQSINLSISE